jgi:hypothetical protein
MTNEGTGHLKTREMRRIYIAAQFESRLRIRPYAHKIWAMGYDVVSSWLNETSRPPGMSNPEFMRKLAMKDIAEIQSADLLIQDTFKMSSRGGAATEFGIALRAYQSKLLWVVGPVRSVFHYLNDRQFDSWAACLKALKGIK